MARKRPLLETDLTDLVACSYFSYTPRAAVEAYDLSFMSLYLLCLGFGPFVRRRCYFILNTVLAVVYSPMVEFTWVP